MKSFRVMFSVLALAASVLLATTAPSPARASSGGAATYKVIAWNDLGMHCACPTFGGFLLLPPFNTVRAQVFSYGSRDPVLVTSTNLLA